MGAVSSIANKKMRMLRERYINDEDQVIFRLLCIRDRIVTDLIKIMAEMDTDEQGPLHRLLFSLLLPVLSLYFSRVINHSGNVPHFYSHSNKLACWLQEQLP